MDLAVLEARDRMLGAIRAWFRAEGFLEVETPIFLDAPSYNTHVEEFESQWIAPKSRRRLWLRTSPEVFHKQLLAAGAKKIYELGRFFRNGEVGTLHNPEFTGLEFYEAGFDYTRIMERTEQLLSTAVEAVAGTRNIGSTDWTTPFTRMTVRDAVRAHAGIDLELHPDAASLAEAAREKGVLAPKGEPWDDLFHRIMMERVEPHIGDGKPIFLVDYPASMAAMARKKPGAPFWAERVELYSNGVELANGFSELTDPAEQRARFVEERDRRAARDGVDPASLPLDEAFLAALPKMPPSTGIAIGLDRVLLLALRARKLADVLAFPFRR